MNAFALKKPALRCSFTAANGTLPAAYPWTGAGEIRPTVDGVPSQFADSGGLTWDLNSNQIQNRASLTTLVGIKLPAPVRRMTIGLENGETGFVGSFMGVLFRGAEDLSTYMEAVLVRTATGIIRLQIRRHTGVDLVSVIITPSPAITTWQQAELIDTGDAIIFTCAGNRAVVANSELKDQQSVGLVIPLASATALQKMDNLEAWT